MFFTREHVVGATGNDLCLKTTNRDVVKDSSHRARRIDITWGPVDFVGAQGGHGSPLLKSEDAALVDVGDGEPAADGKQSFGEREAYVSKALNHDVSTFPSFVAETVSQARGYAMEDSARRCVTEVSLTVSPSIVRL